MTIILGHILRNNSTAKIATFLRHKGISIRHVTFALALSIALWTLYYNYLSRSDELQLSPENGFYYPPETSKVWSDRALQVKNAFLHAYHGYERYAFPHDELKPLTNESINNFNGWGVTAVDSLDTMLLMGLQEEYKRALPMVRQTNFSLPENFDVPFFETTIRYLGGLLSAYALTKDDTLRARADVLGTLLSPVFKSTSGFPMFSVDTYSDYGGSDNPVGVLAEISSFQLEYAFLGKVTSKKEHVDHATTATKAFAKANLSLSGGMYPTRWDITTGTPTDLQLSAGALADSGHEYTLKQYLLTAKTDKANLEASDIRATTHIINNLLFVSPQRQLLYITDMSAWEDDIEFSHQFEHLACFFPGLLALGVHTLPLDRLDTLGINVTDLFKDLPLKHRKAYEALAHFNLADLHLWAAQGLAQTCYLTYADQPTGLGPETVQMRLGDNNSETPWMEAMQVWRTNGSKGSPPGVGDKRQWVGDFNATTTEEDDSDSDTAADTRDYEIRNHDYYLRPEAVESFYILWRTTGDVRWRHRGWAVFEAIERVTKTPSGYASISNVDTLDPEQSDSMPSYFLAETLKYLYLLFIDEDPVPLDKWVFNTEAHPFPVFQWSTSEKAIYGLL
ncbi:glycoside hydrolase family 47 protein [Leucogyrophana mollusca]|uniref:Glycoside hydrolase family 47 protein n=1 Tax=Leucogyrophana mollusca TaxID=85980 RepID=A0ACB8BXK4_9AGAM|nr:glycoside hydrolase family 47 protein [Leucogyrophana mollusca]